MNSIMQQLMKTIRLVIGGGRTGGHRTMNFDRGRHSFDDAYYGLIGLMSSSPEKTEFGFEWRTKVPLQGFVVRLKHYEPGTDNQVDIVDCAEWIKTDAELEVDIDPCPECLTGETDDDGICAKCRAAARS